MTKTLANTMKIIVENNDVLTHAVICGLDVSNVLASGGGKAVEHSWTASEDCIVDIRYNSAYTSKHYIDNYVIADNGNNGGNGDYLHGYFLPVKKSQVIKHTATGSTSGFLYTAFGLKR